MSKREDPEEAEKWGHRTAGGENLYETIYTGPTRIRKTKLMVFMRSNRLEMWILIGANVVIAIIVAIALLS